MEIILSVLIVLVAIGFGLLDPIITFFQKNDPKYKDSYTGVLGLIDKVAVVKSWKNNEGIVTYEGENWRATSEQAFQENDSVLITDCKNLTLTVEELKTPPE